MPYVTGVLAVREPDRFIRQVVADLGPDAAGTVSGDGRAAIAFGEGDCVLAPFSHGVDVIAVSADHDALASVQREIGRRLRRAAGAPAGDGGSQVAWETPVDGGDVTITDPAVEDYALRHCTPPDAILGELAAVTRQVAGGAAGMQVSADEGVFLTLLTKMTGARFAVEVGVFTGYSSICIARGLADGGRLLACDISEEWTAVAKRYWQRAGLDDRIDLRLGPALDTLRELPGQPLIDFAFVDADKTGYPSYYEEIVPRLRPGGLIVIDNVLQGGRTVDPAYRQEHHLAVRRVNDLTAADKRVESVMLPLRDGVTVARKL